MLPEVDIFSDGWANPNPWKWAYWVILSYKWIKKEFSAGYKLTTNNRMELTWAITWLEKLTKKSKVNLYTDSQYTINGIELGWAKKWRENNWYRTKTEKAVNFDLWEKLLELVSYHDVKFHWVKWHNGHLENERCDELATLTMNMDNLLDDINYIPSVEELQKMTNSFLQKNNSLDKKSIDKNLKVLKSWDICRKCWTSVEKKIPKHTSKTKTQNYYYEYYLSCPNCKTNYMVLSAKREINTLKI